MEPFTVTGVVRVHRIRPMFALPLPFLVAMYVTAPWAIASSRESGLWGPVFMFAPMALGLTCLALIANPQRVGAGLAEVSEEGIRLDGKLLVPKASLRDALVAPDPGGARVVFDLGLLRGEQELVFDDMATARKVLQALGTDSTQRTSSLALHGPKARVSALGFAAAAIVSLLVALTTGTSEGGPNVPALVLSAVCMALTITPFLGRVSVGRDGVRVRRWLQTRFISTDKIASAVSTRLGTRLDLKNGDGVDLHLSKGGDLLAERVREALGEGVLPEVLHALARKEARIEDWIAAVRARISEPETFRDQRVTEADLWQIVNTHSAPADLRAVAAVALAPGLDDERRTKLRVVARTCVSPRLRVALTAVASGEEAEIDDAMRSIDEQSEQLGCC